MLRYRVAIQAAHPDGTLRDETWVASANSALAARSRAITLHYEQHQGGLVRKIYSVTDVTKETTEEGLVA
jgi:hypothetical protein